MRLEVNLIAEKSDVKLSLNYNHFIAGLIYRIIRLKSSYFSRWLHSEGFKSGGKNFKMFTFSKLFYFDKAHVDGEFIIIPVGSEISFQVSSPYDRFVSVFAFGLTRVKNIWLGERRNVFRLKSVEVVFEPEIFTGDAREVITINGVFISPLVISRVDEVGRKVYLSHDSPDAGKRVIENLLLKFEVYSGQSVSDMLEFEFDQEYLKNHNRVTKLITLKEGTKGETMVKGLLIPFKLTGTRRLVKFAWDVGLGEKNSMGFGMWDVCGVKTKSG